MELGYHVIIVGVVYIISGILFYPLKKSNVYDRGYAWILFSIFHGVDEVVDGLKLIGIYPNLELTFERIELTTFFLSSSFLLIATLIKIDRLRSDELISIGFLVQAPAIVFIFLSSEEAIKAIEHSKFSLLGYDVTYFTILFGLLPTIPLILLYLYEFIKLSRQSSQIRSNRTFFSLALVSVMMVVYNIGELFGTNPGLLPLLYGEVLAIIVILIIPLEFNLASNRKLQLHLVYHKDGFPVSITKFNTNLSDEVMVLVTGLLSAVNSMVEYELDLGSLEHIETGNGQLYIKHTGELIHAALASDEDTLIQEKLHTLSTEINEYLTTQKVDEFSYIPPQVKQGLNNLVYRQFSLVV